MSDSRSFTSPSGRRWTVAEFTTPAVAGAPGVTVLRFTAADLVLDLEDYPADWMTVAEEELPALARRAQPPKIALPGTSSPPGSARPTPN